MSSSSARITFLITGSVLSSVSLILVNKLLFERGFNFVFTLTAFHLSLTFLALGMVSRLGYFQPAKMPWSETVMMAASGVCSIAFMNFSLRFNSVGFYQVTKLLCAPCMVAIQVAYFSKSFSQQVLTSLAALLLGVAIATLSDVRLNLLGSFHGVLAVLSTSLYQIWTNSKQHQHSMSSDQLQHSIALEMSLMCCVLALLTEVFGEHSILTFDGSVSTILLVVLSGVCAIFVNVFTFALIGKTSAVTYQVVGHCKTIMIIASGFFLFPVAAPTLEVLKQAFGIVLAMAGAVLYGYYRHVESKAAPTPTPAAAGGSQARYEKVSLVGPSPRLGVGSVAPAGSGSNTAGGDEDYDDEASGLGGQVPVGEEHDFDEDEDDDEGDRVVARLPRTPVRA